jgi:hypothetical protein
VAVLVAHVVLPPNGADAATARRGKEPPLVLILGTSDDMATGSEERFATELGLALEEFMTVRVDVDAKFHTRSIAEQLVIVKPLVRRYHAVAVTWINRPSPDTMLVTLAVVESGRILVRTIPSAASPGSEEGLALAAREMLGTAYLFGAPRSPELAEVVSRVVAEALPCQPEPDKPDKPEPVGPLALRLELGASGPLNDFAAIRAGPVVRGGVVWSVASRLELTGSLEARVSQYRATVGSYDELLAGARLTLGYVFALGRTILVPMLASRFGWHRFTLEWGPLGREVVDARYATLGGGLDFGIAVRKGVSVRLSALIDWDPRPTIVRRLDDESTAVRSPRVGWSVGAAWVTSL